MLMRYGQAALLAAIVTLMGNVVWAQQPCATFLPYGFGQNAKCCNAKGCCATSACCKDGKCCKDGASCCKGKKCDAGCTCCKDGKCSCKDKSGGCCNAKKCDASCACCKGKTSVAKMGCGCPFVNKLAKCTAIIMVMPSSLPLLGACPPAAMGMMPHPPMPMGPHAMLPMPLPPMPPGLPPMPGMAPPIMPPHAIGMPVPPPPPGCPCPNAMPVLSCPPTPDAMPKVNPKVEPFIHLLDLASEFCSLGRPENAMTMCGQAMCLLMELYPTKCAGTPPPHEVNVNEAHTGDLIFGVGVNSNRSQTGCYSAEPCGPVCSAGPANAAKVRIIAVPSSSELEMNVGDETRVRCKKMTVKIGDNEITVSRFEDRVRVRGDELKATADSVRSDRKDRIILEGDVVLHYKKDGHSANVTGDRIELNLSSGAVTIKPAEKAAMTRPAVRINYFDAVVPNQ